MSKIYVGVGVIILAGLVGSPLIYKALQGRGGDAFADCRGAAVAGGQIGGPFSLVDSTGAAVTDTTVLAKPSLVYFGYASCPDVCPLDNARNAEAADILAKKGLDVNPVFISVDPARDTPAVLADYVSNFSHLTGLTGTEAQVAAAAKAYKVYYQLPEKRDAGYTVDHTTMTYLMLPKTGFADFFQRDATAQEIADRTACFLKAS
ncbi:MAG: SCO family protein [Rhodoferax sp.]|nr:SCO family protein [Pseudorhodobacter sp.]